MPTFGRPWPFDFRSGIIEPNNNIYIYMYKLNLGTGHVILCLGALYYCFSIPNVDDYKYIYIYCICMCLYASAIFRKPLCIFNIIYIYIHIYIYVYVNIYKHLPLYSCVHLRLEMIYPKDPRIASNGKKCSRALFSTLFAKNQVFWKQSCFFQSKGLAGNIYI